MDRYSMLVALTGQLCGTLLLVSLIVAWTIRRRAPAAVTSNDGVQRIESRLAEMQHSLDAVAIEVERISEAQRFATRLLSERGGAAPEVHGVRDPASRGASR